MSQRAAGTWKAIDIEIYEIDDLGNPGSFIAMARDQRVAAWMADAHNSMLAALKSACEQCSNCDGEGNAHLMEDETLYGQAPGSSRTDCVICAPWRAAITKAEGTKR